MKIKSIGGYKYLNHVPIECSAMSFPAPSFPHLFIIFLWYFSQRVLYNMLYSHSRILQNNKKQTSVPGKMIATHQDSPSCLVAKLCWLMSSYKLWSFRRWLSPEWMLKGLYFMGSTDDVSLIFSNQYLWKRWHIMIFSLASASQFKCFKGITDNIK